MAEETPIVNRLLSAIADSEHDHPESDRYLVDLSRKDALDAVKRITELLVQVSEFATALHEVCPEHALLKTGS